MITYLESTDGTCKFYQVEVKGKETTVSYGKAGKDGQSRAKEHDSAAAAKEYAADLIEKQKKKGYKEAAKRKRDEDGEGEEAETKVARSAKKEAAPKKEAKPKKAAAGKRGKKAAPKKEAESPEKEITAEAAPKMEADMDVEPAPEKAPPVPTLPEPTIEKPAFPVVWSVKVSAYTGGYGLYVDEHNVYAGSEDGLVQQFDKTGLLLKEFRVAGGAKCIVGDGVFLYVGTSIGHLYDLTAGKPRLMTQVRAFTEVYWMDIRNGQIAASDKSGKVALIDAEGELVWVKQEEGASSGWMCYMDETGIYHGNTLGVQKRSLTTGEHIWRIPEIGPVNFGQQDEKFIYATTGTKGYKINKESGKIEATIPIGGPSMGVMKDGRIISTFVTIYNPNGELNHTFDKVDYDHCPASMATFGDNEVYGIRNNIVKYDLSPEALEKVKAGTWEAKFYPLQKMPEIAPEKAFTETTDSSKGVLCECVTEDGKLRVRVISSGYNKSWNVQFPRALREDGAKFVVQKIINQGGFYRAWGEISRFRG